MYVATPSSASGSNTPVMVARPLHSAAHGAGNNPVSAAAPGHVMTGGRPRVLDVRRAAKGSPPATTRHAMANAYRVNPACMRAGYRRTMARRVVSLNQQPAVPRPRAAWKRRERDQDQWPAWRPSKKDTVQATVQATASRSGVRSPRARSRCRMESMRCDTRDSEQPSTAPISRMVSDS